MLDDRQYRTDNPCGDGESLRGYFKATITPSLLQLDLRFVSSVEDPAGTGYTEASFIVEDGMAGAQPA